MPNVKASASADETVQPQAAHGVERITNVLALLLVRDMKQQSEQIDHLNRAGFQAREIAALLGTTPNNVSVAIYQAKKTGKKSKGRR